MVEVSVGGDKEVVVRAPVGGMAEGGVGVVAAAMVGRGEVVVTSCCGGGCVG